jgi:hypothetical protein
MIKNEFLAGSWIGTGFTFLTMQMQDLFMVGFCLTLFINLVALWDRFKPVIFKHWKTSSVGIALILGALVLVWFEKATLSECVPFWVGAFGLFLAKDK